MKTHSRSITRGFTLIELTVVLAVMAVLMATMAPDFIQTTRIRLGKEMAQDITHIQDAASWFFLTNPLGYPAPAWPGSPGACAADNATVRAALFGSQIITAAQFTNPWQTGYTVRVLMSGGNCVFRVGTSIPSSLTPYFVTNMPNSRCNATTPNAWCVSEIPRPPAPAAFQAAQNILDGQLDIQCSNTGFACYNRITQQCQMASPCP